MKMYDAAKLAIDAQLRGLVANCALSNPMFNPRSVEADELKKKSVLDESLYMAIGVLARLDYMDDPLNDQAQASARELIKILSVRNGIDVASQLGVPV